MKKFAFAAVCTLALVGFVMADEFNCTIKKVDGNSVSFTKGGKKGAAAEDGKADAAADVKVNNAKAGAGGGGGGKKGGGGKGGGMVEIGDPVENGLKNDMFTKIDEAGVNARLITNDAGKITQVIVLPKGGGKGGGGKKKG